MTDRIHVYLDTAEEFRWKRVAPNGLIVADSGESYDTQNGAIKAAEREAGDDAEVVVDE